MTGADSVTQAQPQGGAGRPIGDRDSPTHETAATCPVCSARYTRLHLADSRGQPRELVCTACGATFWAATCPACHRLSTHVAVARRERRYERPPTGTGVLTAVRCGDCGRIWTLTRLVGPRDLVSPAYWRMRLGLDGTPTRRLDEERSDFGRLVVRGFVSWIVVMPIVGFALAGLLFVTVPLFGVLLGARDLWTAHPLAAAAVLALAAVGVVALYVLARRRFVDSALARLYVRAMRGPIPAAVVVVALFVRGVWGAG